MESGDKITKSGHSPFSVQEEEQMSGRKSEELDKVRRQKIFALKFYASAEAEVEWPIFCSNSTRNIKWNLYKSGHALDIGIVLTRAAAARLHGGSDQI